MFINQILINLATFICSTGQDLRGKEEEEGGEIGRVRARTRERVKEWERG